MTKILVNLTLLLVTEEIEYFFERHPDQLHQLAFSINKLRQELINYVLNKVPVSYMVIDENQKALVRTNILCQSLEKRLDIEAVIYQGADELIQYHNSEWIKQHMVNENELSVTLSH